MSLEKKFKICDPLYNYIYLERDELALFNHPAFQRLRSIRQLGFSDEAFPSATHTRFTHSLGVSHLAGEAFDSIFEKNKGLLTKEKKQLFRKSLRMASLLHDLGHGPFSHSSECLMPSLKSLNLSKYLKEENRQARHEDFSLKLILEEDGIIKALKQMGLEPFYAASILHPNFKVETDFFKEKGLDFLPLLRQILSSPFDVDRMDYLCRDSLFCGVRYGLIDFVWLIAQMNCHIAVKAHSKEKKSQKSRQSSQNKTEDQVFLSIDNSALYTLESLILGRQHMRLVVYFHHKSTIYNEMLKKYSKERQWTLPSKLSGYLEWTDSKLLERLRADKNSYNNSWAKRIVDKKPYFRLYESPEYEPSLSNSKDSNVIKELDFFKVNPIPSTIQTAQSKLKQKRTKQDKSSQTKSIKKSEQVKLQNQRKNQLENSLFSYLQEKLNQEKVHFIVVDSKKNSIKPSKKEQVNHPVFLENKSLAQVQKWNKTPNLLFIPYRNLKRVYVPPEQFPIAKKILKSLL